MKKKYLVVFGTGMLYRKRKEALNGVPDIQINAFLDNNEKLWGTMLDGIQISSPQDLCKITYDYILIMSTYEAEMYEQLLQLNVDQNKILYWQEFMAAFSRKKKVYRTDVIDHNEGREKVLIISTDMDYNGGSMAAIYAAMCLQSENYKVDVAVPDGDMKLVHELNSCGVDVILYDALPYIYEEEWIKSYKVVMVNVLQMIQCACEISKYRPVLWWIHEPSFLYAEILKRFSDYANKQSMEDINIYAVSKVASYNFNIYFPNSVLKLLSIGIPLAQNISEQKYEKQKLVFAVIGSISENKAQDIFLKAADVIKTKNQVEFWLIGAQSKNKYGNQIVELAERNPNVHIKGLLMHEDVYAIFPQIDVVVCTSHEETMSIAICEGMMFGKVCITTDATGVAEYIEDGVNGFVVQAGNVKALCSKMQWIIDNKHQMSRIGDQARKTYEKFFAMEIFGRNLDRALRETINKWNV